MEPIFVVPLVSGRVQGPPRPSQMGGGRRFGVGGVGRVVTRPFRETRVSGKTENNVPDNRDFSEYITLDSLRVVS